MSPVQHIEKPDHAGADAYWRARTGAVHWDRSAEGRIWVTGADRADWLQGLVTNDVAALAHGRSAYACYLTPQGRLVSDMRVLALEDRFLIDVPPGRAAALVERLGAFVITEDVTLTDATAALARLSVHGPEAWTSLAALGAGAEPLQPNEVASCSLAGHAAILARARDLRLVGFDVYVDASAAAPLIAAMEPLGVVAATGEVFEALRIEAGVARYGVDMDESTIPLEAGIEDEAISFTKGCYVGQEIIVRVVHRGHGRVARRLVGLVFSGAQDGASSSARLPGAVVTHGGKDVGRVTSATWSPALERVIALASVARELAEPGTGVGVRAADGGDEAAVVAATPFVAHEGGAS